MQFLDTFADILRDNWDKVLLLLTTPVVAGFSVWKVGNIFIKLIQNWTAKKYTAKQKIYTERVESAVEGIKDYVAETIKSEVKSYADTVALTFNELQEKTQQTKQSIYEEIFDKKMEVQEIAQDLKSDIIEEVNTISEEVPEVEEVVESEKKKIDLL